MNLRPLNRQKRCYELSWRYLVHDERYNGSMGHPRPLK
jgi:hypothetical protein